MTNEELNEPTGNETLTIRLPDGRLHTCRRDWYMEHREELRVDDVQYTRHEDEQGQPYVVEVTL